MRDEHGVVDRARGPLAEIINEALEYATREIDRRGHKVELDPIPRSVKVPADPNHLVRAFLNLLLNAAQAMDEPGILSVRFTENSDTLSVTVADTGAGITEEDRDSLFNPFFTTKDGGTGLGLAIVHKIIKSHNGTITASNAEGGGAEFTVVFPAVEAD